VTIWLHPWTSHPVYCPLTGKAGAPAGLLELPAREVALLDRKTAAGAGPAPGRGTFASTGGTPLIPDLKSDFIFSALAQELGLIGIAALLLVYMLFTTRGFRISLLAEDGFSKLLAPGSPSASRSRRSSSSVGFCGSSL